jgi:hypothetical protein
MGRTPEVIPSLNQRLKDSTPDGPNLEMVRCSDMGQVIAIFQAFNIQVEVWTLDVTGYFHTVVVLLRRAMEQGILTLDGPAMSHVFDMGGEDCPRKTGQISSFLAECVGKIAHERVLRLPVVRDSVAIQRMLRVRGAKFGVGNPQARIVLAPMYSDDMCVVCPVGTRPTVQAVADEVARRLNLRWQGDKGGPRVFIGYELRLGPTMGQSMALIKSVKVAQYAVKWDALAAQPFPLRQVGQSVCGQINHAATVELALKPLATRLNRALHAHSRLNNPEVFAQSAACQADIREAANVLRGSTGIPLTCARDWPEHDAPRTITQRGDACVKEDGYNGWGVWFVVPHGPNPRDFRVYALFDSWTTQEEALLGHNAPGAEALCILLGDRGAVEHSLFDRRWHDQHLILTDSETSFMKFGAVKMGSALMDNTRDDWLRLQSVKHIPATVDWCAREVNVGADLLSKGRWDLFQIVCAEAGLPPPIRLTLSAANRDVTRCFV